jgi:branched-chain amino acid transport system substrate-binding protein
LEVVFNQEYAADIKDMTPLLSGIKASNPDFLLAITYLNDSVPMVTQARELGLKVDYFFELLGPAQPSFVSRFGDNANGILSVGFWSRHSKTTGSAEFFDGYVKRWNMPPDDKDGSIATSAVRYSNRRSRERASTQKNCAPSSAAPRSIR